MTLLLADLSPQDPLRAFTHAEVQTWFRDPGHLVLDPGGLERGYVAWRQWIATRPPRTDAPPWSQRPERMKLCDRLLAWAREGRPLHYTTIWRERQGGRRYFVWVDQATRVEVFGGWPKPKYRKAEVLWPQQIPKKVRRVGIRAPAGRLIIQVDINRAFLQFLACWSRDQQLVAALASQDFHQSVADQLGVERKVAKVVNNSLVGLAGARGLQENLQREGIPATLDYTKQLHDSWWSCFPAAADLRDRARNHVRSAANQGSGVQLVAPDGRTFSFSPAEASGTVLDNNRKKGFPSIFSSFWRAIEGVVTDLAIADLHQYRATHDLQFVLGMFDGLVYTAPESTAQQFATLAKQVVEKAMARLGLPGTASTTVHPFWWSDE